VGTPRAGIRCGGSGRDQSRNSVRTCDGTCDRARSARAQVGFDTGPVLSALARNMSCLGRKVGIVSKIGSDPLGRLALECLVDSGVEVHAVKVAVGRTTGLTVILPYPEHRFILTYPGTMFELSYEDIDLDYICSARHFHISSFFLHRGLRSRMLELFRTVKAAGLSTSLDTNDDPDDKWDKDVLEVLKYVDFFFPNEREAKKLTRTNDLARAAKTLAGLAKVVGVKCGPEAAICQAGNKQWSLTPPAVQVIDPVGAGDSFSAGFLHQYLLGADLEDCLAYANLAGAYSCTREGGTEAFKDRRGMASFFREHWTDCGKAAPSGASAQSS